MAAHGDTLKAHRESQGLDISAVARKIDQLFGQRVTHRALARFERHPLASGFSLKPGIGNAEVAKVIDALAAERAERSGSPPAWLAPLKRRGISADEFRQLWNDERTSWEQFAELTNLTTREIREACEAMHLAPAKPFRADALEPVPHEQQHAPNLETAPPAPEPPPPAPAPPPAATARPRAPEPVEVDRNGISARWRNASPSQKEKAQAEIERWELTRDKMMRLYTTRGVDEITARFGWKADLFYIVLGSLDIPLNGRGFRPAPDSEQEPWPAWPSELNRTPRQTPEEARAEAEFKGQPQPFLTRFAQPDTREPERMDRETADWMDAPTGPLRIAAAPAVELNNPLEALRRRRRVIDDELFTLNTRRDDLNEERATLEAGIGAIEKLAARYMPPTTGKAEAS